MMLIEKIRIVGLKWFNKSNIEDITITIDELFQIIIGSNGAGKSSLIDKCLPCVGAHSDFKEVGLLHYHIKHHGHSYELISEIKGKSTRHTFKRDDEVLNDAGTGTVQRSLIEQEFNITPEIHKLLTGRNKFTVMPPTQTMNMLMRVSGLDLAYANGLFQTLKDRSRDCIGALRHIRTKIEDTTSRLSSIVIDDNADELIKQLNERIVVLTPISMTEIANLETDVTKLELEVKKAVNSIASYGDKVDGAGLRDVANVTHLASVQTGIIDSINVQLSDLYTKLHAVGVDLQSVRNENVGSAEQCKASIAELNDKLLSLGETPSDDECRDVHFTLANLKLAFEQVGCLDVDPSSILKYTRTELAELENDITSTKEVIVGLNREIDHHHSKITLADTVNAINCTKCGADVHVDGSLPQAIYNDHKAKLADLSKRHISYTTKLTEMTEKRSLYDGYDRSTTLTHNAVSCISAVTDVANDLDKVMMNPNIIMDSIATKIRRCELVKVYIETKKSIVEATRVLGVIESGKFNRLSKLEAELTVQINDLRDQLELSVSTRAKLLSTAKAATAMITAAESIADYTDRALLAVHNECLVTIVTEAKKERELLLIKSGMLESELTRRNHLINVLKDLESQEDALIESKKDLDLLSSALSPKQGLIAEQMTMFMRVFFGKLNGVLDSIFTDGIRVAPKEDISNQDYKFPLEIAGFSQGTIADGSAGEQEVINLAFRIALMKTLDLDGYPLFLDETGANFDDAHRDNMIMFVKDILASGQVSQVFMVSHFFATYGGIANFDCIVLQSDNLTVIPPNANENVIIK